MKTLLKIKTKPNFDCIDITPEVEDFVQNCEIEEGSVLIFTKGSTGAITTMEYKEGVIQDLKNALEKIAPKNEPYEHIKDWGDDNGFSHVRAAFMKPSILVPFENKQLQLGTWQQIVLLNFDTKEREREVILRILTS